jgi:hypothetical protein
MSIVQDSLAVKVTDDVGFMAEEGSGKCFDFNDAMGICFNSDMAIVLSNSFVLLVLLKKYLI